MIKKWGGNKDFDQSHSGEQEKRILCPFDKNNVGLVLTLYEPAFWSLFFVTLLK